MSDSGERRPTLREIAASAGVSVMTVSYTFNDPQRVAPATRERVLATADRLGYQGKNPWATALRTGRAGSLGVVFSESLTYAFGDPQAIEFLAGVASACTDEGLGLTLIPTVGDEEDVRRVVAAPVDGYVFWTTEPDDPSLEAAAATRRTCVVQGGPEVPGFVTVGVPERDVARQVGTVGLRGRVRAPVVVTFSLDVTRTRHIEQGLDVDAVPMPVTAGRLAGYRDAALETGLRWEDVWVVAAARNDRGEAREAFAELLQRGVDVDAVLATSDVLALGVLDVLRDQGRAVPDDVAVAGWDDGPGAVDAGLTTVHQSMRDQGRTCGLLAAGCEVPEREVAWRVVERSTTRVHEPDAD